MGDEKREKIFRPFIHLTWLMRLQEKYTTRLSNVVYDQCTIVIKKVCHYTIRRLIQIKEHFSQDSPILHGSGSPQLISTYKQVNMSSIFSKVQSFLCGCITPSYHGKHLPFKQWRCSITYCTSTNPPTPKFIFTGYPETSCSCPCGKN